MLNVAARRGCRLRLHNVALSTDGGVSDTHQRGTGRLRITTPFRKSRDTVRSPSSLPPARLEFATETPNCPFRRVACPGVERSGAPELHAA